MARKCANVFSRRYATTYVAIFTLVGVVLEGCLGMYFFQESIKYLKYEGLSRFNRTDIQDWEDHDILQISGSLFIIAAVFNCVAFVCLLFNFIWKNRTFLVLWLGFVHTQIHFALIAILLLLLNDFHYIAVMLLYSTISYLVWLKIHMIYSEERETDDIDTFVFGNVIVNVKNNTLI